ncbi:alpha/beta hydrolase [Paenibacillus durus]|uniref:Carboxylesterase n=1 Tax=Paenibacillus durus TaxID=44251 RepID=A0A089J1E4_PAEDU|nr:alpha/beta hydrolase [Paenibacillus durus]AIQ15004.1 carboxylesterase [Paenibacillus durus]
MIHIFRQGSDSSKPTLVLFHGTGGNEHDMLPLAEMLSPGSSLLGIRGNVLENGMPRFFRRLSEGVFDEADLVARTHELKAFLDEAAAKYGFDPARLTAVGYSNGANIAGSLLMHYGNLFSSAVLLHPMVPLRGLTPQPLGGVSVFIGAGVNDPLVSVAETKELHEMLASAGADVTLHWSSQGHRLSAAEAEAAKDWLDGQSFN